MKRHNNGSKDELKTNWVELCERYQAKYSGQSIERVPGNFSQEEKRHLATLARLIHDLPPVSTQLVDATTIAASVDDLLDVGGHGTAPRP